MERVAQKTIKTEPIREAGNGAALLAHARLAEDRCCRPGWGFQIHGELARLGAQDRAEVTDFVVNVRFVLDGLGDFLAQQGAVTEPEKVEQPFHY